jgi:hypothetical protein
VVHLAPSSRALVVTAVVALLGADPAWGAPELVWRTEPLPAAAGGASSVAVGSGGRWASGGERGFQIREAGGAWRRFATRGAVRDLAFGPDGALWVASDAGLLRLSGERLVRLCFAPGEAPRRVARVAVGEGVAAAATDAGLYWSRDGRVWHRLDGSFGASPVNGIAFAAGDAGPDLWIAAERGVFAAALPREAGPARARRVGEAGGLRPALDVRSLAGRVVALGPDRLLVRARDGAAWETYRPTLPPGASARRIASAAGRLWIATDRGLSEARAPEGPWERASAPAGSANAQGVAGDATSVLVAAESGLISGALAPELASPPSAGSREKPRDCLPDVAELQRAVLVRQDLDGDHLARMRHGVERRGWLPEAQLRASYGSDTDDTSQSDQTFVSGDTRHLFDHDLKQSRGHEFTFTLTWDLGDIAYHPEQVDVSVEGRQLVQLRDDVLDEVNQLYFDRLRALDAARRAPPGSSEAAAHRLRAAELAAGLDAWTGGWFGRRLRACRGD